MKKTGDYLQLAGKSIKFLSIMNLLALIVITLLTLLKNEQVLIAIVIIGVIDLLASLFIIYDVGKQLVNAGKMKKK